MPQYLFKCYNRECQEEFEAIEKLNTKFSYCPCGSIGKRIHGRDLPAPPILYEGGAGGFYKQSKRQDIE